MITRDYGYCEKCGSALNPLWFIEEEYKITADGFWYKTGRTRRAVDYLECPNCFARYCVDDSFDGPWH